MVKLHVKKADESQFLYETTVEMPVDDLLKDLTAIYNGRLKIQRICAEMEELAKHGITLPPNMMGLTDDQIVDLKLKDEWADKCVPSGGAKMKKDPIGRRNGMAPNDKMAEVLTKTMKEAKDMISKKKVQMDEYVTQTTVKEAIDILRGAVMIVYPMNLPPHDNIRMEFENTEDLEGTQASTEVLPEANTSVWFSGKEMLRGKLLKDFVGKNEKTKIIAKLQKRGLGVPQREQVVSEEEQKKMMAYYYKKQEDYKKLQAEADDAYMDQEWADSGALKRNLNGLRDIKWGGPR
ncbi:cilia- and flagella-associated protein 298-A-like [Ylistrum balloti]|uniref:cilia- and flagella-associated protein 298-A-like n=1 Tax=Ylistrum balloti TaxID=509963 RepID=UPI002905F0D0|nr:cilia- and flagella-associated protein 298-A-like [Ylistrum balloti]